MNHPWLILSLSSQIKEVAVPVHAMDSDHNSSTCAGGGYFRSAPTSPNRLTELYCGFDQFLISGGTHKSNCLATVPFSWEDKPGVPKSYCNFFQNDFAFDVSCEFSSDSVWAEDLFHAGVIKPLGPQKEKKKERERGRERVSSSSSSSSYIASGLGSSRSRRTRTLSPLGSSDYRRQQQQPMAINTKTTLASTYSSPSASSSEKGSRKWSFKDLFLFRSSSDGRAMDRDPFKKYSAIFRKHDAGSGSVSKRRPHELHYTMNRAVSNDMKRKTYLPYKQGIFGIGA